jgi:hypothetical protein
MQRPSNPQHGIMDHLRLQARCCDRRRSHRKAEDEVLDLLSTRKAA